MGWAKRKANRKSDFTLEQELPTGEAVECTHCGIGMTAHCGRESRIRYFCCSSCGRWVSSAYSDILRADAKVRLHSPGMEPAAGCFDSVKRRLEEWLHTLDDQDPYRVMGISPLDPPETIRNRYRELAFERHPDRGGSAVKMRELNLAYERIAKHRQGSVGEGLQPPGVLPLKAS